MEIIKREKGEFGEIKIDFYLNKDRAILVTIEQLAQGFGYKNRKGIERMLERNSYLRNDEYSVIAKVPHNLGGTQETRLFNKRGIFEIGMLSRTEKGKAFRAWIYDYIEELEKENANFRFQRALEKPTHKTLNEAISKWDNAPTMAFPTVNNLLLKLSSGKNKKKLIEDRGGKTGLDCLTSVELAKYQAYEKAVIPLIELNMEYSVIRDTLSQVQL
ncbi:BRO-N domain-containing protein [Streptococcus lutetiensis]|uniref:BRO-N domain-containing protein n=1 Tax=Streptococcus lutetiensis TaxID=150055 RepID=UPI00356162F4